MLVDETTIKLNERNLLLRNAREEDSAMLLAYLKIINGETKFLTKDPEEITLTVEDERKFINEQNTADQNLLLLGFVDGEYAGNCSFSGMGSNRYKHRVSVGIALCQQYTGLGIGKVMMEKLLDVAKEIGIEQMELEVVTDNERAISLYKKMGFKIFGTLPHHMKYRDGTYADVYWMMKQLPSHELL